MALNVSTGLATGMFGVGTFIQYMDHGTIEIRTGFPPASADAAVTGTLLGHVTRNGQPFVQPNTEFGLRPDIATIRGEVHDNGDWMLNVIAQGTAGWWRWRWYPEDNGAASVALPRLDGAVGDTLLFLSNEILLADSPIPVTFKMKFGAIA